MLLTAAAVAFGGLALTGSAPEAATLRVQSASASTLLLQPLPRSTYGKSLDLLDGTVQAPAPVVAPVAPVEPPRASRSRRAPAPVAVAKPKVVVRKAAPKRVAASGRWVRPVAGSVSSPYGPRWGRQHKGLDFTGGTGTPIRAVADGVVTGAGYLSGESGYGQITLVRHSNGAVSAYAHQSRMLVRAGDRVRAGELIGYVGSTGNVTGPHLHLEIRIGGSQVNPASYLRARGVRL